MRKTRQFKFIQDPEVNTQDLNVTLLELAESNPEVTFADGYARIEYTKSFEEIAPPVTETGITFTCEECPLFRPVLNRKGEPDGRVKYGDCDYSEFGRTWKTSAACQNLYTMLKNGKVSLTLNAENEEGLIEAPELIGLDDPRHPHYTGGDRR